MARDSSLPLAREVTHEPFWAMGAAEAFAVLHTAPAGLSEEDVAARRQEFGANEIPDHSGVTRARLLFRQLASPLILILIAAGVVTVILRQWVETAVIFAAVAANTLLGFWQEWKAETALALLRTYVRTRARVQRSGKERSLDASQLVPGDVIRISAGERVPADARLTFATNLEVDESILTGESLPVAKDPAVLPAGAALAERVCMVFSGTLVVEGVGDAVVIATGTETEFGRIAALVARGSREPTPLQRAITRFAVRAGTILSALVLLLFGVGVALHYGVFEMFLIVVAVAVSAVPEGLPVALTVVLAIGVERLAKRRGIVRRLAAAETLGSTTLILTDKTGTLTTANMELAAVLPHIPGGGAESRLLADAVGNTDVILENPDDPPDTWRLFGRPLETALVRGAARFGVRLFPKRGEVVERMPFSSREKFSVSVIREGSRQRLVLLGAPEVLLAYSDLPAAERAGLTRLVEKRARSGERVLGVAVSAAAAAQRIPKRLRFSHLTFEGLLAFRDPLRREVASAIGSVRAQGIRTVIVTGDHRGTAEAVARELGMVDGTGAVLTGEDLSALRPEELKARSGEVTVYARVTPEQKLLLVKLYQSQGEVVAVTGDGVNDAPALQAADVGVAVGSGSDVAKSAADLVLLDDNFETIAAAVSEGRRVLSNIKKVIIYLLSDSLDELFLIGGAILTGMALPLSALQIIFVNFFSDSFPAVALAFEHQADGADLRPVHTRLFDRTVRFLILVIGVFTSFLLFVLYYLLLHARFDPALVRTFIFASFATYTLFLAFSIRSLERSILSHNPFTNRYLTGGVLIGLLLTAAVIYLPPLRGVFGTVALPPGWALGVLGVGLANVFLVEFGKWITRTRHA